MNPPRLPVSLASRAKSAMVDGVATHPRPAAALCLVAVLLVVASARCNRTDFSDITDNPPEKVARTSSEQFEQAIDALGRLHEFDENVGSRQVLDSLNEWIKQRGQHEDWRVDPLFQRQLTGKYERAKVAGSLPLLAFQPHDFYMLREAVWMRDVSRWVVARQMPILERAKRGRPKQESRTGREGATPVLPAWYVESESALGEESADKLAIAYWLFDWTVRNIQLDAMPPEPEEDPSDRESRTDDKDPQGGATLDKTKWPAPGPGVKFYAWQSLLLGHGDALQRARVFILLARQQGIDVVMLAVGEGSPPRPWLPAVLLKDQLFLFDTALGLPLPSPSGRGVATLTQARASAKLLASLDVGEEHVYPVKQQDLDHVAALIDATPAYLSQRMKLLEDSLSQERKLVLAISPIGLKRRLDECPGIDEVRLWTLPYETFLFVLSLRQDRAGAVEFDRQFGALRGGLPLLRARLLHFQGKFDKDGAKPGAKEIYFRCRPPDEHLAEIMNSKVLQRQLGLEARLAQLRSDPAARDKLISAAVEMFKQQKQHASYWLGLVTADNGQNDVAVDYFDKRTLSASPDGPWTHGARYNLARAYEALGRLDEARSLYLADDSPQRHGNLLRARRLQPADEASKPAEQSDAKGEINP